ncbi:MAG: hypothetical protein M9909_09605 [Thermomicrobiales bacterium]|nr:hypothetical protein [Thermomicrobiales bacterium]
MATSKDDEQTYKLIMRRLLSESEPLRFIFVTSRCGNADNPNVFQICTLNETNPVIQKRQEIGRGLRLPVNQFGERIHDRTVNRPAAVATSYIRPSRRHCSRSMRSEAGVKFGD